MVLVKHGVGTRIVTHRGPVSAHRHDTLPGVPPTTDALSFTKSRKRLYPLVKELAADGIPVAVTCRVLKLARQPYYRWLANPVTDAEYAEAHRANALFDLT